MFSECFKLTKIFVGSNYHKDQLKRSIIDGSIKNVIFSGEHNGITITIFSSRKLESDRDYELMYKISNNEPYKIFCKVHVIDSYSYRDFDSIGRMKRVLIGTVEDIS